MWKGFALTCIIIMPTAGPFFYLLSFLFYLFLSPAPQSKHDRLFHPCHGGDAQYVIDVLLGAGLL